MVAKFERGLSFLSIFRFIMSKRHNCFVILSLMLLQCSRSSSESTYSETNASNNAAVMGTGEAHQSNLASPPDNDKLFRKERSEYSELNNDLQKLSEVRNYLRKQLITQRGLTGLLQRLQKHAIQIKSDLQQKALSTMDTRNYYEESNEELPRMDRNYYGWMDFGKRSVDQDDYMY